jgi:mono/diheme cytochrome c family protein
MRTSVVVLFSGGVGVMLTSFRDPIRGAVLAVALVPLLGATSFAKATTEPSGRELYLDECAPCHGAAGRGDGPEGIYFSPRPRDLHTGFLDVYDDEEVVARLRDGTPLMLEFDPEGLRARVLQVEQLTAHLQRLPSIDWARVDEGSAVFMERCSICHGAFGKPWPPPFLPEGVQRPPQDLWDPKFQRETSDEELVAAVQHGRGVMPGIPGLQGDEQAKKLLPFLRLLSPGFEIYSYYCAVCHGDNGHPEHAMAPDEYKPRVTFDRAWLAKKDPERLRVDVAHMLTEHGTGMPHFREVFDDDELRSIVRYLKGVKAPGDAPSPTPSR